MMREEQHLEICARNRPMSWPMQVIAYFLGLSAVYLAVQNTTLSKRAIPATLAFLWLWVGLAIWLPRIIAAKHGIEPKEATPVGGWSLNIAEKNYPE
jgi:hypothetical protein